VGAVLLQVMVEILRGDKKEKVPVVLESRD
jgi:hypothetical protein